MFTKSGYGPALGIAIVAAGASIAALTGCASGTGSTAASAGTRRCRVPAGPPAPTAPAPSASAAAGSGSAADVATDSYSYRTPECTIGRLRISYTDNGQIRHGALAGMSKTDNVVTFTNVGRATCVIEGFPGVAALNSHGAQVKQAIRSTSVAPGDSKVRPVYLKPGGAASALVAGHGVLQQGPPYVLWPAGHRPGHVPLGAAEPGRLYVPAVADREPGRPRQRGRLRVLGRVAGVDRGWAAAVSRCRASANAAGAVLVPLVTRASVSPQQVLERGSFHDGGK